MILFVFVIFAGLGVKLVTHSQQSLQESAEFTLATDRRAPVLYLRSFGDEEEEIHDLMGNMRSTNLDGNRNGIQGYTKLRPFSLTHLLFLDPVQDAHHIILHHIPP